ncbi:MAG: hypothetical protein AAF915_06620 [Cyanobacteria bacterium P01_D01_bin.50]
MEIVNFRPGKNPFESLAVALAPLLCFLQPRSAEVSAKQRRGLLI